MSIETDATRATAQTIITDLEGEPVTIDKNPAHLDRFLAEISDYFRRSGKCLKDMGLWGPLFERVVSTQRFLSL